MRGPVILDRYFLMVLDEGAMEEMRMDASLAHLSFLSGSPC